MHIAMKDKSEKIYDLKQILLLVIYENIGGLVLIELRFVVQDNKS